MSVAEEAGLNLGLTETPKTGFLATRPIYYPPLSGDLNDAIAYSKALLTLFLGAGNFPLFF